MAALPRSKKRRTSPTSNILTDFPEVAPSSSTISHDHILACPRSMESKDFMRSKRSSKADHLVQQAHQYQQPAPLAPPPSDQASTSSSSRSNRGVPALSSVNEVIGGKVSRGCSLSRRRSPSPLPPSPPFSLSLPSPPFSLSLPSPLLGRDHTRDILVREPTTLPPRCWPCIGWRAMVLAVARDFCGQEDEASYCFPSTLLTSVNIGRYRSTPPQPRMPSFHLSLVNRIAAISRTSSRGHAEEVLV
ncbi:hypothetical protein IE53DRAFT_68605 [Violaceomyces palustris]|uniref:Uncharacterized protein n=1 Tax=Violaceomyces palustris TaxID=1673888 RepID=A0ACD0NYT1_9BASI|nr:hypothetical protein IE53DRAFT_68605 [Violaceomyces palustris]